MLRFNSEGKCWEWGQPVMEPLLKRAFPDVKLILSRDDFSFFFRSHFKNLEQEILNTDKPYIIWSGEPYSVKYRNYPPILDIRSDGPLEFRIENGVATINISMLALAYISYTKLGYSFPHFKNIERPHCLAYCNSNPIQYREDFFRLARNKIGDRVHGLGRCSNTEGPLPGRWKDSILFKTYSKYNFVMSFENCVKSEYITEKILAAFVAGAIPVFWGDDQLAKQIFNERAFIRVTDFKTLEDCIDYLIYLESHSEEMEKIRKEPVFKNNQVPEIFDLETGKCYEPLITYLKENLSSHIQ